MTEESPHPSSIAECRRDILRLTEEKEELQSEFDALCELYESLQKEHQELVEKCNGKDCELQAFVAKSNASSKDSEEKSHIQETISEFIKNQEELFDLKNKFKLLEKENISLKEKLEEMMKENETLARRQLDLEQVAETDELKRKLREYETELEQKRCELQQFQSQWNHQLEKEMESEGEEVKPKEKVVEGYLRNSEEMNDKYENNIYTESLPNYFYDKSVDMSTKKMEWNYNTDSRKGETGNHGERLGEQKKDDGEVFDYGDDLSDCNNLHSSKVGHSHTADVNEGKEGGELNEEGVELEQKDIEERSENANNEQGWDGNQFDVDDESLDDGNVYDELDDEKIMEHKKSRDDRKLLAQTQQRLSVHQTSKSGSASSVSDELAVGDLLFEIEQLKIQAQKREAELSEARRELHLVRKELEEEERNWAEYREEMRVTSEAILDAQANAERSYMNGYTEVQSLLEENETLKKNHFLTAKQFKKIQKKWNELCRQMEIESVEKENLETKLCALEGDLKKANEQNQRLQKKLMESQRHSTQLEQKFKLFKSAGDPGLDDKWRSILERVKNLQLNENDDLQEKTNQNPSPILLNHQEKLYEEAEEKERMMEVLDQLEEENERMREKCVKLENLWMEEKERYERELKRKKEVLSMALREGRNKENELHSIQMSLTSENAILRDELSRLKKKLIESQDLYEDFRRQKTALENENKRISDALLELNFEFRVLKQQRQTDKKETQIPTSIHGIK